MKILHTADWHLGKSFNNYSLLEEQAYILKQFAQIVAQQKPDVVLLAGDIYDRSVPPADAVRLFDEIMSEVILDLKIPVIAIAGNHDNSDRVNYCNYLLRKQGLHIFGRIELSIREQGPYIDPVVLSDEFGEVYFYPVPYTEPEVLRYFAQEENIRSHEQVMKWLIDNIQTQHPAGQRAVFMGHAFIRGGTESESERKLLVGGAAEIPAGLYAFFDYTAFGHLHQAQSFLEGKLRYSGSILKYSFSEAHHHKAVLLVDLDAQGNTQVEKIPLVPRKDVKRIQGEIKARKFELDKEVANLQREDFLEVTLLNQEIVPNAMQIVQESFPNAMTLKWPHLQRTARESSLTSEKLHKMSENDLFLDFYKRFMHQDLDKNKQSVLEKTIQKIKKGEE